MGRFFVTHSRTSGTQSHPRLVQEIAQERGTNGDEEMRVCERQRCHRELGPPAAELAWEPVHFHSLHSCLVSHLPGDQSLAGVPRTPTRPVLPSVMFVVGWKEGHVVVS